MNENSAVPEELSEELKNLYENWDSSNGLASGVASQVLTTTRTSTSTSNSGEAQAEAQVSLEGLDLLNAETATSGEWTTASAGNVATQSEAEWSTAGYVQTGETQQTYDDAETTQTYYSRPVITQTQRIKSQPVITKKIISQPVITKIITEQPIIQQRIVQTPVKRRKVVRRPVYTQTIKNEAIVDNQTEHKPVKVNVPGQVTIREKYVQPTVNTIEHVLNLNKEETRTINHEPITRATTTKTNVNTRTVTTPGKVLLTQPVRYREVVNNNETLELTRADARYETKPTVTKQAQNRTTTRTVTKQRPAAQHYYTKYIQPTIQRENVQVNLQREADKYVTRRAIVEPVKSTQSTRVRNVTVPASVHTTQPVVQNYYHETQVNHVQTPYVRRYAVPNPVPVPVPVVKRRVVIRKIPIPVKGKSSGTKIVNNQVINVTGEISNSSSSHESCFSHNKFSSTSESSESSDSSEEIVEKRKKNKRKRRRYRAAPQTAASTWDLNAVDRSEGQGQSVAAKEYRTMSLPMMKRAWKRTGAWGNATAQINWQEGAQGWSEDHSEWNKGDGQWTEIDLAQQLGAQQVAAEALNQRQSLSHGHSYGEGLSLSQGHSHSHGHSHSEGLSLSQGLSHSQNLGSSGVVSLDEDLAEEQMLVGQALN